MCTGAGGNQGCDMLWIQFGVHFAWWCDQGHPQRFSGWKLSPIDHQRSLLRTLKTDKFHNRIHIITRPQKVNNFQHGHDPTLSLPTFLCHWDLRLQKPQDQRTTAIGLYRVTGWKVQHWDDRAFRKYALDKSQQENFLVGSATRLESMGWDGRRWTEWGGRLWDGWRRKAGVGK